ncbi:type II toxin-antitoxin system VapB family antitoxin [Aeromicrobium choanae]|uniref:Antitoxin VapB n=1 Tax=Aeromicrobium choanae TaxID=1736691 RepID=A0A1T4Z5J6_9ACTN|nr:type II toxin-antitoxin system VapB family antitoxin [Aeromicrobium choanae]SKB08831.1 antitoxin VapB [Aeromicrobium choanae]
MALNIKNEHVHAMAREVALRTGRSQTSAIELALEKLLAELERESSDAARLDRIHAMQQLAADAPLDSGDLYDEAGLPR